MIIYPKPFEPKELILRIKNILNKTIKTEQIRILEFSNIKIDLNKLLIIKNKNEFKINNTEKIILEKMINNPGKTFSRENIGNLINLDKERSIDVIITRLRKKIEIDPKNPKFLQTIRGAGYVLWIEVIFLKKYYPKKLFYRALLIVAVPVIVLQLIITIVFFDSLWIKTNKGMTRALVNEISTFVEVYDNEKIDRNELKNLFSLFLDLNIEFINKEFDSKYNERWFSPIDRTLRRELKSKFNHGEYWFDTTSYKELIDIRIKYENGYFKFLVSKDRVTSSSARLFALWITVPAVIMVIISLIFLKNQTRPITNLRTCCRKIW
jgi:DNA-binding winged helix-turn-helix (wHTH) protein